MKFGLYLRSFLSDRSRPVHQQIQDVVEVCHVARDSGFGLVAMPQHWFSYPTVWPQPFPTLGRLAPETGDMQLMTGILLLPLHNPVQVAEEAATLDHISQGRFVLGLGLGYREAELEAAGITRKDRAPRMREGIELIKKLWSGEEVDHEGQYWRVHGVQMGFTPLQQPHPPIWMACQSEGAVRRSARLADSCYLAPQIGFELLPGLIGNYRDERQTQGLSAGHVALSRGVSFARDRAAAVAEAREAAESSYRTYSNWNMQEQSMVPIHISSESEVTDWAVAGNRDDLLERFSWLQEQGVQAVTMTMLNLPKDLSARKEYLQDFSEAVIRRMKD